MQFRGYDSCGICTFSEGNFVCSKLASTQDDKTQGDCIDKLVTSVRKEHGDSFLGIGHTRWATHGLKVTRNAHPHMDYKNRIALVHNGIIDNFKDLRAKVLAAGIKLSSETDTEIIAQLISLNLDTEKDFKKALELTLEKEIHGTYALAIMHLDEPDKLYCVRNGSPLLIGKGEDFFIVSSDAAAFKNYTESYFHIDNNDIVELTLDMKICQSKILIAKSDEVLRAPRQGYDYFMLQEIYDQPDTINLAMSNGGRLEKDEKSKAVVKLGGLEENKNILLKVENLIIFACGTSYFASVFVANLARQLGVFNTVQVVDASGFNENMLPKHKTLAMFVSQSGESYDVIRVFEIVKAKGIPTLGVVNKVESTLGRSCCCGVYINAGREVSVASTKAFSGQVVTISLAILYMAQIKDECYFLSSQFLQ